MATVKQTIVSGIKLEEPRYFLLRGDAWTQKRFEIIKREARSMAKVTVTDHNGESQLLPIQELEWFCD